MNTLTSPNLEPEETNERVRLVECPNESCLANPGQRCESSAGEPLRRSHDERHGRLSVIYDQYEKLLGSIYDAGYMQGYAAGEAVGRSTQVLDRYGVIKRTDVGE